METNPVLKKLGYSKTDRVVIIHTDDIGMCQASISAFKDLWEFGLVSSGATMVPCPWFLEVAKFCKENPEVDMGVHVTLTSEWETYRWGPLSTRDVESGLLDSEGCFYHTSADAQQNGKSESVYKEIKAQIDRALTNGINPTHMDTHMGTVASIKFVPLYLQLARAYNLPPMLLRLEKEGWMELGLDEETANFAIKMVNELEESGIPLLDRIATLDLNEAPNPKDRIEYAKKVLGGLQPGITHFIIHPSKDTPELRAITPDYACRVADYITFSNEELRDFVEASGLNVIGYKALKNIM
jgi:predicted glycoside hydrolase/deacetylase ChbG (UPF0249 family)